MKIRITKEHIRNGEIQDSNKCAVAMAINEVTGLEVEVGVDQVFFGKEEGDYRRSDLSKRMKDWIYDFDTLENVKPINFILKIPETIKQELGWVRK